MHPTTPHSKSKASFFACAVLALAAPVAIAATAMIDTQDEHQLIRGFGGATVFQPPGLPASLSPSEMDTLFLNGPGQLGFSILRIRVASDDAWRAVELAHAQGAIARGAIVMATPWSPPAAMKDNGSLIGGQLLPANYAAYATYLDDFAKYMAANGAPLYAISVQNEPDIVVGYESCDWTPEEMLTFCRDNAAAITATRPILRASFIATAPLSSTSVLTSTKAAMKTLKIAPISAPCMTLTPTASPASIQRTHRMSLGVSGVLDTTSASAKKLKPMATCCEATPQHAVEKKAEFNAAANPPSVAANGENFNCRKKVQAPRPRMNSA